MPVLELEAPEGALTLPQASDRRLAVETSHERFSSPEARPGAHAHPDAAIRAIAAQFGMSQHAVQTAYGMLERHLTSDGQGRAIPLTATISGMRRVRLGGAGLMVRAQTADAVALIADPLVLMAVRGRQKLLHWSLLPVGPSVTARADALRFLRGLATGGQVLFQLGSDDERPALELEGGGWELEEEWRLFEDLATLEEWSGVTIPMPREVSAEEATLAAQAARWARTEQVPARLADSFTFDVKDGLADRPHDIRLFHYLTVKLLGAELPLGQGAAMVEIARLDRRELPLRNGGSYEAHPAQSDIVLQLKAPPTRQLPAFRTQTDHGAPAAARTAASNARRQFARPAERALADVSAMRPARRRLRSAASTERLLDELRGT